MYLDDQAAIDLTVTVEGEDYEAEATEDLDEDGVDDTALVARDDGTVTAFSDTDGDGRADLLTEVDGTGHVTGQAVFDERSGDWIGVAPEQLPGGIVPPGTPGDPVLLDAPAEPVDTTAGQDTDGDGVADSVVRAEADGGSTIYTDVDGDGLADVSTGISADGEVTIAEQHGDGAWTVVEQGRLTDGGYEVTGTRADDGTWDEPAGGPVAVSSVDPATGEWVRRA